MQTAARSPNDTIQFALVGAGGMGSGDANQAIAAGAKLVAVADLYTGRLERAKERWGKDVITTRDYREIINRKDVDAVIVATSDHWHQQITCDALLAGKDVYCQKPMVQTIEQGHKVLEAEKKSGRILQVGSQYASSLMYEKARDLLKQGAIGEPVLVSAWLDRNTALGAWQYSIPLDASTQTVDWDRYIANAPKRPFDAARFFRWRNYRDYGTGVAGDLFVHLITGLHFASGEIGPSRIYATGGTRFWIDGRDVPDLMLAVMDYPKFQFSLKVNFESGLPEEQFGVRFTGSEGSITAGYTTLTLSRRPREKEPGTTISTFSREQAASFLEEYRKQYPVKPFSADLMRQDDEIVYETPRGEDAHRRHHRAFWNAVRTRQKHIEDGTFGMRACGPALLTNTSLWEQRVVTWDPRTMRVTG
jgi:predicted dehydrogenase